MEKVQRYIEKFYKFTDVKVDHIRSSEDNNTFKISSNEGLFFARLSKRLDKDAVESMKELEFIQFLKNSDVSVAGIINNVNGTLTTSFEDRIFVIFEWIEGDSFNISSDNYPTEVQAYNGGSALASVHNASVAFGTTTELKRTMTTELERALSLNIDIEKRYTNGVEFLDKVKRMIDLTKDNFSKKNIIIHNDFRPHNVLFLNNEISCIVDFDWICVAPPIKDLALALVEWSLADGDTEVIWSNFVAFFRGYCDNIDSNFYPKVSDLAQWIEFSCVSDAATYVADIITEEKVAGTPENFEKKELKSYMFRKIQCFKQIDIENHLK